MIFLKKKIFIKKSVILRKDKKLKIEDLGKKLKKLTFRKAVPNNFDSRGKVHKTKENSNFRAKNAKRYRKFSKRKSSIRSGKKKNFANV